MQTSLLDRDSTWCCQARFHWIPEDACSSRFETMCSCVVRFPPPLRLPLLPCTLCIVSQSHPCRYVCLRSQHDHPWPIGLQGGPERQEVRAKSDTSTRDIRAMSFPSSTSRPLSSVRTAQTNPFASLPLIINRPASRPSSRRRTSTRSSSSDTGSRLGTSRTSSPDGTTAPSPPRARRRSSRPDGRSRRPASSPAWRSRACRSAPSRLCRGALRRPT